MAPSSDPVAVGTHADEHLKRFLRARAAGDAVEMRRWWGELVVDFFDRMDGFVAAAHKGRLDDEEHELAVQMAMIRFSTRLVETFDGVSMGQLVNACKTLARGICIDVQRMAVRSRQHAGASLDEGWDATGDEAQAGPAWEAGEAWRRFEQGEADRHAEDFLGWALPQLGENRRSVIAMTFEGSELEEICAELGIERDNAYQRRSRGLKDLAKLKEQYES